MPRNSLDGTTDTRQYRPNQAFGRYAFVLLWETTRIARAIRKRVSYLRFFGLVCEVAMPGWSGGFAGPALPLGWCLPGTGGRGQVGG